MPRGCRKSKQTSWGGGTQPTSGAEKALQRPSPTEAWDAPHLGVKTGQWGAPVVPLGWSQPGEGPETTPWAAVH